MGKKALQLGIISIKTLVDMKNVSRWMYDWHIYVSCSFSSSTVGQCTGHFLVKKENKKEIHDDGSLLTEQYRREKKEAYELLCCFPFFFSFSSFGPLNTDCRTSDTFSCEWVERVLCIDFFFFSVCLRTHLTSHRFPGRLMKRNHSLDEFDIHF